MRSAVRLVLLLLLSPPSWPAPAGATPSPRSAAAAPAELCRAAVAQAEREAGLPPRLLAAIARVESGRRDPEGGAFGPWPWTINAEGRGSFFPDRAAAVAAVRALQAAGVRSIDVGCMQINLRHHPHAFASVEEAFDPLANARYAARFLSELQATRSDWMRSAGHYHSQTPDLAEAYRARVTAAWEAERGAPAPPPSALAVPATHPAATLAAVGGPSALSNRAERVAMLPAASPSTNSVGRGLDAYRALPIPVAGRAMLPLPVISPPAPVAAAIRATSPHTAQQPGMSASSLAVSPVAAAGRAGMPPPAGAGLGRAGAAAVHFLAAGRP